jgi:predicted ATP-dependent serine protease
MSSDKRFWKCRECGYKNKHSERRCRKCGLWFSHNLNRKKTRGGLPPKWNLIAMGRQKQATII